MECPRCGHYNCHCRDYQLREWQREHENWRWSTYDREQAYEESKHRLHEIRRREDERRQEKEERERQQRIAYELEQQRQREVEWYEAEQQAQFEAEECEPETPQG